MFIRDAIILAGGLGTRLQSVVDDVPKSMAPVNGIPFLEYQLTYLSDWGIKNAILAVGYKKELIMDHFGHHYKDLKITYAEEDEPLGTGGAIKKAMEYVVARNVLILNGDTYFKVSFDKLLMIYQIKKSKIMLILKEMQNVERYGTVTIDYNGKVTGFSEKGSSKGKGFINGGVYYINKAFFESFDFPEKFSFEKDFLEKYFINYDFHGMVCNQYFLDIGIPGDFKKAQDDFTEFEH